MKFRGWSIDGFGLFRDFTVRDLPDGLIVFYGANEAGKTTLLEFLRSALFGPPNHGRPIAYPPLGGGRHGGRLIVGAPDGEYTVERDLGRRAPPVLVRPDGTHGGGDDLARLLGGIDEPLFRSVFAFSLADLQSFAALDAAGVRDKLFSATLAGAGRSARAVVRALREQAAERLAENGTARANALIADLNRLRPRLAAARRQAMEYPALLDAARRCADEVTQLRATLAERRAARARYETLLQLRPLWEEWQEARAALAQLASAEEPPAGAEDRLRAAREQVDAARGAHEALQAEQEDAERQLAALGPDPGPPAIVAEVEALYADLTLHRYHLATAPWARARQAEAERALAERLRPLGPDWDAARLAAWGKLGVERETVRDWQARLREAAEREQQARWHLEVAAAQRAALQREVEQVQAQLPGEAPADPEAAEAGRRDVAQLRVWIEEMTARQAQGEARAETVQDRERALRTLEADAYPEPPRWLPAGLGGALAAAAGAAVWNAAHGRGIGAAGFALAALAAGAGAAWVARQRRWAAARAQQREAARRTLRSEMETARRARDADWHQAAQLAERVARAAEALGLPRSPTPEDLEACERALAVEAADQVRRRAAEARLAELAPLLRQAEDEERRRCEACAAAGAARAAAEAEWTAWKSANGFPADAAPGVVLERVSQLAAAGTALAACEEAARELRQIEPLLAAWEARVRALLGRGAAVPCEQSGESLVDALLAVRQRLQDEAPQRSRRRALDAEIRERAARLAAAEAERRRGEAEWERVRAAIGAADEAEVTRRREQVARRAALRQAIAERERRLAERTGGGPDGEVLRAALAAGDVEAWRRDREAATAEIEAVEQRLYQAVERQYAARHACRAAEASSEVATLEGQWAALNAELATTVRDWRVLAAAEGLVSEALEEFERTRQPAVLAEASRAFAGVTSGRYERVVQDESGQTLVVVERGGRRKYVASDLSRGTTEQLYLSIRLGLAKEFCRTVELPLVMDDVLVNFDPERARAMARELGAFAREHQILFFTCHPAMRDMLLGDGRAARVVEL